MPAVHWDLAGDQCGAPAVAILDDLQQVVALLGGEWLQSPVIEDQQLHPADCPHQPGVTTIAACQCEIAEQAWDALIQDGMIVATCPVPERTGEPRLSDATGANDDQVLLFPDPAALCQLLEQRAI